MLLSPVYAGAVEAANPWWYYCLAPFALGMLAMWLLGLLGRRKVVDYSAELSEIRGLLNTRERDLKDRETEVGNLRAQMKNMEGEFGGLRAKNEKLELDLKAANKIGSDANAELVKLRADISAANTARLKWEDDVKRKDGELSAIGAKLTSLTGDFDKAKLATAAQIAALTAGAATAAATIKSRDAKIGDLEAKLGAKDKELEDYKLRLGKLEGAVKEGGEFKIRYDKDVADLRAQLSATKAEADKAKAAAAAELAALTAGAAAAAATLKSRDARIAELEGKLKSADDDWKIRFAKVDSDLKASVSAKGDWEVKLQAKDKELADLRAQLTAAKADGDKAKAAAAAELAALTAGAATAAATIKSRDTRIAEFEGKLKGVDKELADLRAQLTAAKAEGDKARAAAAAELAALTAGAATAAATIKGKDSRISDLEARIAAFEAERAKREKALADSQTEIASLRASMTKSTADWEARLSAREAEWAAKLEASATTLAETRTQLVDAQKTRDTIQSAAAKLGIKTVASACPQHLSDVHGIGTVFEQRLFSHGIGTFFEVAHLDDDTLISILEIKSEMLRSIDLNAIRADALKLAKETNTVGRTWSGQEPDDFEPIDGIGHVFEKRLYDAGICTYESLLNTPQTRIMEIVSLGKKMVTPPDIPYWLGQAKNLLAAKQGKK